MRQSSARSSRNTLPSCTPPTAPPIWWPIAPSIARTTCKSSPETRLKWITRVPATLSEAQAALAQADPQTMAPLLDGYRYRVLTSTYGGVAQRWVLISSEQRLPQAQRTVDKQLLKHSEQEVKAFKHLCRTAFACAADAQQALSTFEHGLQATFLAQVRSAPRHAMASGGAQARQPTLTRWSTLSKERWRHGSRPVRHSSTTRVVSSWPPTNWTTPSSRPRSCSQGYKGQGHAERGFRFLKDPRFLASSLYLKKPERIMALLMVMTVCLLVYAALEYRIRQALKDHGRPFQTKRAHRYRTPPRGGSFTILWGFTCSSSLGSGLWC